MHLIKRGVSSDIDTTDATATAAEILIGETAYVNELKVTGTMPNIGAQVIVPVASGNTISLGYHNGTGGIAADANFVAENIKAGVDIWNVLGTYETPITGDALVSEVFSGKTFYSDDSTVKLTGTFAPNAADIKAGVTLANVEGTFTADGDATSADILLNKIAYANGAQVVGTIPTITEGLGTYSTVDGTTVKILAPEGYCDGTTSLVTVTEANLLAENIKEGVTIFGVTGTYTGV
jgi:hypothetical protein